MDGVDADDAMGEWRGGRWDSDTYHIDVQRVMTQVRQLLGFRELTLTQKKILHDLVEETVKTGSITWGAHQAQGWEVDKHGRPWTFDTTRLVHCTP